MGGFTLFIIFIKKECIMSNFSVRVSRVLSSTHFRRRVPYLLLPIAMLAVISFVAFRPTALSLPAHALSNPLVLPPGWSAPPTPADNPITAEKFTLGRYLFYETALSGDSKTSCSSCHNSYLSFEAGGSHSGAFAFQSEPARMVPRLMNIGYDTVLTWDGHIQTLEDQVQIAVQKKGDLQGDTTVIFPILANNPAYTALFTQAFGDPTITLDRIAKAIATFERCLISGNSPYDQYLNGNASAMSSSAIRGMSLFFDTTKTNCSECHNNLGSKDNASTNIFTDNNYYRTGTFENITVPDGGYGFDTTTDTLREGEDPGRAAVTGNSMDIGKFRTPSLRNVAISGPYGADGTVPSLQQVIENYNDGGNAGRGDSVANQDPRIKPLGLSDSEMLDLEAFLTCLTDLSFISNPAFQYPGAATASVDDHIVASDLSLYPNPSTGAVNVECPDFTGATEATLISESGVTVWRQSLNSDGKLQLNFSGISNGSYRLILRSADAQQTVPIVLQR
jgi:cytochrome c peroxidase